MLALKRLALCALGAGSLAVAHTSESPLLQDVLNESLSCLVAGSYKRAGGAVQEAHVEGSLTPQLKLVRCDVFVNSHMAFCWSHILTKRYNIDVVLAEF